MVGASRDTRISNIQDTNKQEIRKRITYQVLQAILWILIGIIISPFFQKTLDVISPADHITEGDIEIWKGKVCILGDYEIAAISDTNSMDPIIDNTSLVLAKNIGSIDDVQVGDIISFYDYDGKIIVHRVVMKHDDYVLTKGDNTKTMDNIKIKSHMLNSVVVGILY